MEKKAIQEEAFMGRITAASTHEFNNVLAVIKESSELMGDIISLSAEENFIHRERFEKALEVIRTQIQRGKELCRHLNAFAHSADSPLGEIELTDTLRRMVALCQRFARNRGVSLEVEDPGKPLTLLTRPVRFQMIIFYSFELLWRLLPGRSLHLAWELTDNKVTLFLKPQTSNQRSSSSELKDVLMDNLKSELQRITESLEGAIHIEEQKGIILQLPLRLRQ